MTTSLPVIDPPAARKADTSVVLPLGDYDRILVSFSGGKDSVYMALDMKERLLREKIPLSRMQLHHQCVDGEPGSASFFDWPVTEAYCRAFAEHLGVKIFFAWRHGGFRTEMLKDGARSLPASFHRQDGTTATAGGIRGKIGTRRKFPQPTSDLKVRWCSAILKIDVFDLAINNEPEFKKGRFLVLTGERRQESTARSKYAEVEAHRCSTKKRRVDLWRSALDRTEAEVWEKMRTHGVVPHPAYRLGWGRVSCLSCIFGLADQWASVRAIAPELFAELVAHEADFGCTLKQGKTLGELADGGTPYPLLADRRLVALATGRDYRAGWVATADWKMPAGAFSRCGGPT